MKTKLRNFEASIVFILKVILYVSLFGIFYGIFSIEYWQLLVMSRTAAVTSTTFVIVGLAMVSIYGQYDIGKRKSKPIIYSISLATVITDIVTYLMLAIMNTNEATNYKFSLNNIGILFVIMLVQILVIIGFAYMGNGIYFSFHDPESCCIITSSQDSLNDIARRVNKFKKQFRIDYVVDYRDTRVKEYILKSDAIFLYDVPVKERTDMIAYCYQNLKHIYFNPEMADIVEISARNQVFDDVSLIGNETKGLTMEQRFIKRTMDIVLGLIGFIISLPIMAVCGVLIKLEDGGKIFFKQNRATRGGKIFSVYKLRTMKEDVENYSAIEDDVRVTKIGRILRKYRLDEVPQFINVLKGEMSIVGPRPEMLANIFNYTEELPEFEYRLRVKAGLTGYAQIAGKYNTSPKDKLILDLMYIEQYSFWLDIKLIFQTVIVLLKKDSTEAFTEKKNTLKFVPYVPDEQENGEYNEE